MSLVKVNLLSDLDALALYPFKRLLMQRKGDQNYQRATKQYSARLQRLHRTSGHARRLHAIRKKLALESDTLRLDGNTQAGDRLHGITIAKSSFCTAQVGEPIVFVCASAGPEANPVDEIIAHGLIQAVSESEIKIKLLKPLELGRATSDEQNSTDASVKSPDANQTEANFKPQDKTKANQGEGEAEERAGPEGKQAKKIIDFRIKYDAGKLEAATEDAIDEYGLLVMETMNKFEAIKCDPVLHRNLLGLYDERTDLLHEKARVMTFDELPKARGQQRLAIEQALKRRMSLIEGPAGSGKSLVAAHIAANMSRLKRAKILVCSPIQENVDKLAELIHRVDGVQVVKIPDGPVKLTLAEMLGHARPKKRSDAEIPASQLDVRGESSNCLLEKLVDDEIYLQVWTRSKDSFRNNHDSLHSHAYRMVTGCSQHRRREIEAKILSRADVVCCTNKQAGSYLLSGFEFDMLILDDVQVSSELDCLVPLMARGIKQVVLLSDSRKQIRLARTLRKSQSNGQLSGNQLDQNTKPAPITRPNGSLPNRGSLRRKNARRTRAQSRSLNEGARKSNNNLSLSACDVSLELGGMFERLLAIGLPAVDLRNQFRLHHTLSNFTNHHFYLGRLKDDAETNKSLQSEIETKLVTEDEERFNWLPNRKYLTAMFSVKSEPEDNQSSSSSSKAASLSREQIQSKELIEKLQDVTDKFLFHENIQESRVGIIVNRKINTEDGWAKKIPGNVKIGTIADFIGQEKDFTIVVAFPQCDAAEGDELSATAQLSICSELNCDFKLNDSALNCALTRARLGMVIIASDITADEVSTESHNDSNTVNGCRGWHDLVKYYTASGLLVG